MSIRDASIMPVVAVEDLDRAISFYRDALGLEVRRSEQDPTAAIAEIGNDRLYLYKSTYSRGEATVASLLVSDLESTVRELRERGVVFQEYDSPAIKTVEGIATMGETKAAWFKDSEGNTIGITNEVPEIARKAA